MVRRRTNVRPLDDFIFLTNNIVSPQEAIGIFDNTTPEQFRQAAIDFAGNPPEQEVLQKSFDQDIKNLIDVYKTAEQAYKDIYTELLLVDSYKIGGKTIWASRWKDLWMAFTDLITQSKTEAASISVYAKRNVKVLFPYLASNDHTLEQKNSLINLTLKSIRERQTKTTKFATDFRLHEAKFVNFKADFTKWAEDKQQSISKRIANTKADIKELQADIANLTRKIVGLGIAISVVSTIGCSAALYDLKSQRNDLHVKNAQAISNELAAQLANFHKLGDCFTSFWQNITGQLEKCLDQESLLQDELNSPLGILPDDIEFTTRVWIVLANSLDLYIQA
ncbi:3104_t:CDS:2 [Paraglomus brasilianum]|uniref:3104_t:CDS:1 n=1 Tax=Paraglomus brasilianum TaxID=144538 RepID=A0A9N9D1M9_9GLOM|nr:3104_t:CDS:2 [Paraglomus brasilianum]